MINHRNGLYNRADSSKSNSISRVNQDRKYIHNDLRMSTSTSTSSTRLSIPKLIQSANPFTLIKNKCSDIQNFFDVQLPMFQYLWPKNNLRLRFYLVVSFMFMFVGKWLNVKVPFILQRAIDTASSAGKGSQALSIGTSIGTNGAAAAIALYGVSRALAVVCSEIKTCLFSHVSQNVMRKFANNIFSHLHSLDSEFHLQTPSGVISVAYVRAVRGFQTMLFQIVFSVLPTMLELALVSNVLYKRCGGVFAGVTLATFSIYLIFTVWITQWRINIRKEMVDIDNKRNGFFIDSILNHEVVKLFTNERRETNRFDTYLQRIQELSIESTYAIAVLNLGQAAMFCVGLTSSLLIALNRVQRGTMSVGDLVAVNSMLLQLSIPFNFMGFTYQELRQSFVDMGYIRNVLMSVSPTVLANPLAPSIETLAPRNGPSELEFRNVSFHYGVDNSKGDLLKGVNIKILAGQNVAIVGPSGSGKSTTLRLISRMLDPASGHILLDGVDTRAVSLDSLRGRISVVPQDTSLFDETVEYNLRYGNVSASHEELQSALEKCNLIDTIEKLPLGLQTSVGERGARLSGGERQKVSIARALLKNPTLILCDEVTSSVDAFAERDIVDTLRRASEQRTTLTVAHRLSSIVHCDSIIVMEKGAVVERGTHKSLLKTQGVYAKMWHAQNGEAMNMDKNITPNVVLDQSEFESERSDISTGFSKDRLPFPESSSESLTNLVIGGGKRSRNVASMMATMMGEDTASETENSDTENSENSDTSGINSENNEKVI